MPKRTSGRPPSEAIANQLKNLQKDYTNVEGKPFQHFYCPILCKDEQTELCLGHIVGQKIPNSSRTCVVQRKDVDGFYGRVFEADFTAFIKGRAGGLCAILRDPDLNKKFKQRITVNGEVCKHYYYRGSPPRAHSRLVLEVGEEEFQLVLQKNPQDLIVDQQWSGQIAIEFDCGLSGLVSVIKAAYLTLFRLLGYRYALSAAGLSVGYSLLGDFYRSNFDKDKHEAREAGKDYFRDYVNMVRPIVKVDGPRPSGTIEDGVVKSCFGTSGKPFGIVVCVRANKSLFAVLMPAFDDPEAVATYLDFLKNGKETIRIYNAQFDNKRKCCLDYGNPTEMPWPKIDDSFRFD